MSPSGQSDPLLVLDRSRTSRSFTSRETLWTRELKRILVLLANHRKALQELPRSQRFGEEAGDSREPYLSIAIFGPSGSGKSSLLRTLLRVVNHDTGEDFNKIAENAHKLEGIEPESDEAIAERSCIRTLAHHAWGLEVLQPDKFAEGHHFLYAFLASALNEDQRRRVQDENRDDRGGVSGGRYGAEALSEVQQAFEDLSELLRVVDGPATGHEGDPLGVSLEKLESHTSGMLLRPRIDRLIESLASALTDGHQTGERNLVLLPVDDADQAPGHLVPILRIVQSYLLHPQLVPIFTFTDRTAEETLRQEFEQHVGSDEVAEEAGETAFRLPIAQHLAIQYLARSFPARNRIRLGPAPARVRDRRYVSTLSSGDSKSTSHGGGGATSAIAVSELLHTSSRLLFGASDHALHHEIVAALRPSTLRRQLHVVDEMVASGVERYLPEGTPPSSQPRRRWVQVFDRASWALMNVHRDILREYDLYLEDLYSWSPGGLRRVLLGRLLRHKRRVRNALLQRWRYRVDSRRGEVISLLAANAHRPWMPGQEPTGDEGYIPNFSPSDLAKIGEGNSGIGATTAYLWFMSLVVGFYLPQVLASHPAQGEKEPRSEEVSDEDVGIGWNLKYGAVNAVRAAVAHRASASLGMMFLKQADVKEAFSRKQPSDVLLGLRSWCYIGFQDNEYWVAVSFWRGLSLIARLLEARRRYELENEQAKQNNRTNEVEPWEKRVLRVVRFHLLRGLVPGSLLAQGENWNLAQEEFPSWSEIDLEKRPAKEWVNGLMTWARSQAPAPVPEQPGLIPLEQDRSISWSASLLRRLHGADIVGDLLPRLNSTYIEQQVLASEPDKAQPGRNSAKNDPSRIWTAGTALSEWTGVLLEYWRGIPQMQVLLRTCPLLVPFDSDPLVVEWRRRSSPMKADKGKEEARILTVERKELDPKLRPQPLDLSDGKRPKIQNYWEHALGTKASMVASKSKKSKKTSLRLTQKERKAIDRAREKHADPSTVYSLLKLRRRAE